MSFELAFRLLGWLRREVHGKGSLLSTDEIAEEDN